MIVKIQEAKVEVTHETLTKKWIKVKIQKELIITIEIAVKMKIQEGQILTKIARSQIKKRKINSKTQEKMQKNLK